MKLLLFGSSKDNTSIIAKTYEHEKVHGGFVISCLPLY